MGPLDPTEEHDVAGAAAPSLANCATAAPDDPPVNGDRSRLPELRDADGARRAMRRGRRELERAVALAPLPARAQHAVPGADLALRPAKVPGLRRYAPLLPA